MKKGSENRMPKKYRIPIIITVSVACIFSILATVFTYAIFTNSLHAQRTIAAYDTAGDKFSSNYLLKGSSGENVRTVYTTGTSTPASTVLTVCNYPQGRQTMSAQEDISYTLTFRLVKEEAGNYVAVDSSYLTGSLAGCAVAVTGDGTLALDSSNVSGRISDKTITGGAARSHSYSISFNSSFINDPMPNLYLEAVAEPTTPGYPTLRGIFKPELRAAGAADSWTGSFSDDRSHTPSEYDGYNYVITGVGSGTVTLTWDATKLDLSDVSLHELAQIANFSQTSNSVTFPVDAEVTSRYELQFYKVGIPAATTWAEMDSGAVTFVFTE